MGLLSSDGQWFLSAYEAIEIWIWLLVEVKASVVHVFGGLHGGCSTRRMSEFCRDLVSASKDYNSLTLLESHGLGSHVP